MLYWENNNFLREKLITIDLISVYVRKRIKIEILYFNIYHRLVYKHNDFLLHYADKVHLLIRKEIMN